MADIGDTLKKQYDDLARCRSALISLERWFDADLEILNSMCRQERLAHVTAWNWARDALGMDRVELSVCKESEHE